MDFDWSLFAPGTLAVEEISESFEDPFSLRFLPDSPRFSVESRYFSLGRTPAGRGIFSVYTSTGKVVKVIAAREMTKEEGFFYDRKSQERV